MRRRPLIVAVDIVVLYMMMATRETKLYRDVLYEYVAATDSRIIIVVIFLRLSRLIISAT